MSNAVLKADGNIEIPVAVRDATGAAPGQSFAVIARGNVIMLVPQVDVRSLRGSARGKDTSEYRDK